MSDQPLVEETPSVLSPEINLGVAAPVVPDAVQEQPVVVSEAPVADAVPEIAPSVPVAAEVIAAPIEPPTEIFDRKKIVAKVWVDIKSFPWLQDFVELEFEDGERTRVSASQIKELGFSLPL